MLFNLNFENCKIYRYIIHKHFSKKSGVHYDLRIQNKNGRLTDFASKKLLDALDNKKVMLFRQKDHPKQFLKLDGMLDGELFELYDNGIVKIKHVSKNSTLLEFSGYKFNGCFTIINYNNQDFEYLFAKVKDSTCNQYCL